MAAEPSAASPLYCAAMDAWDEPFGGVIGRYHFESRPWWPPERRAPEGAPNVVLIVLDDVGFAQLGCFGSDIDTPVLDGLAAGGLRFTNFHTTALCSPTRACLLTGRNHHSVGMGRITELAAGFPGYHARIPRSAGFVSEILRDAGFATWAVGKWHLTPEEECHEAASRARWPLGRGFERFYGFMGGETHQFAPALICDNHQIEPPGRWQDGYHLTEDLIDQARQMVVDLRAVDENKPFFLYLCLGACHAPHQAPSEWVERYRGRFDAGWDTWRDATFARQLASGVIAPGTELSPRPDWVRAWADLSAPTQRLYARYMEAFAGFLSHADHHLGRLFGALGETRDLDRTLVMVLSDNGASSEGGPTGSVNDNRVWNGVPRTVEDALGRIDEIGGPRCHNNYPWGWTVAGNTPFRRWKREVHEGGVADPLIVSWPAGVPAVEHAGGLRRQYVHAIDVAPTILELVGAVAPAEIGGIAQRPLEGLSFACALADPGAPSRRRTQYYEMFGCRALYHEGWKAVTYHPIQLDEPGLDRAAWELYHVEVDPSECHDLAAAEPERLAALIERWWAEAESHNVLPLDNRPLSDFVADRPLRPQTRRRYAYRRGACPVPEAVAVNVKNRTHAITALVEVPADGADGANGADGPNRADGVLISQGSLLGGWVLFVVNGQLRYVHSLCGWEEHRIEASRPLTPGRHTVVFRFERTAEHQGRGSLYIDGEPVGAGEIPRFTPNRFALAGAGLTVGRDGSGLAVCDDYEAPFPFNGGIIGDVVVEVDGEPFVDPVAEAHIAIATQ